MCSVKFKGLGIGSVEVERYHFSICVRIKADFLLVLLLLALLSLSFFVVKCCVLFLFLVSINGPFISYLYLVPAIPVIKLELFSASVPLFQFKCTRYAI